MWTHRIMLEASLKGDNSFVTLTYSDEHLPRTSVGKLPELSPPDLQLWLKRFRKAVQPLKVRFYAVGEYGTRTERPHYHLAVFGFPPCRRGMTKVSKHTGKCCDVCDLVQSTWGKGQVYVGTLSPESAQYIAGYVTKKMTAKGDPRLGGRYPEFSRMSLRPGIGSGMVDEIASTMMAFDLEKTEADVPVSLRHGSKQWPLGRTMRRKLRERIGWAAGASEETVQKMADEMRPLRESAFDASKSYRQTVIDEYRGKVASMEAREKIYKQRKDTL